MGDQDGFGALENLGIAEFGIWGIGLEWLDLAGIGWNGLVFNTITGYSVSLYSFGKKAIHNFMATADSAVVLLELNVKWD